MEEMLRDIVQAVFAVDSIWSVVLRAVLWFVIAIVIIVSADTANPQMASKNMKANLGFFLMFMILTGGLIYLLFGFTKSA